MIGEQSTRELIQLNNSFAGPKHHPFHPCRFHPRPCCRATECAPIWRRKRELEKDQAQKSSLPVPRRAVASRYNTMLLMLRLQFRHNFLSRPFRLSDAWAFVPLRPDKENVISGGRSGKETRWKLPATYGNLRQATCAHEISLKDHFGYLDYRVWWFWGAMVTSPA